MIIHNPILTGSFTVNGTDVASITGSAASITAINSYTASQNILNGTYATTGSNTFKNPQTINSNLIVTGSITAATLVVQTITSSVIYSSGSNVFGNNIANTQVITGSVNITGSLAVVTNGTEFQVTNTGVKFGNVSTDSHSITGSMITSGSVGIGVNPYSNTPLAIKGTYGLWVERGATDDSGVGLYHDGTNAIIYSSYQTTGAFGGLTFYTSNIQRILINATGSIGIGSNNITGKLMIYQGSAGNVFQSIVSNQGGSTRVGINFNPSMSESDVAAYQAQSAIYTTDYSYSADIIFATKVPGAYANSLTERMRISAAGYVSIGKTSSQSKALELYQATDAALRIQNSTTGTGNTDGLLLEMGGSNAILYNYESGYLAFGTTGTERIRITSTGKITYADSTYFTTSYAGGFVFNSGTDAYNNFIISDNGNATLRGALTQNASDERLKNNIQIIPNAIEKISQLKGVTFEWNKEIFETSRTTDIGVIAQDVQKVLPDAVTLAPFDTNIENNTSKSGENYLTVYYEKLIPLLIEGIKELQAQITELKNK